MPESSETPEEAFAKAEVARDDTVRDFVIPAKTRDEQAAGILVAQERIEQLNRAAREIPPPQKTNNK